MYVSNRIDDFYSRFRHSCYGFICRLKQSINSIVNTIANNFLLMGNYMWKLRWLIGDFTLTPQYFASSLSVNCHDSQFHRLPTISLHRVCQ